MGWSEDCADRLRREADEAAAETRIDASLDGPIWMSLASLGQGMARAVE